MKQIDLQITTGDARPPRVNMSRCTVHTGWCNQSLSRAGLGWQVEMRESGVPPYLFIHSLIASGSLAPQEWEGTVKGPGLMTASPAAEECQSANPRMARVESGALIHNPGRPGCLLRPSRGLYRTIQLILQRVCEPLFPSLLDLESRALRFCAFSAFWLATLLFEFPSFSRLALESRGAVPSDRPLVLPPLFSRRIAIRYPDTFPCAVCFSRYSKYFVLSTPPCSTA